MFLAFARFATSNLFFLFTSRLFCNFALYYSCYYGKLLLCCDQQLTTGHAAHYTLNGSVVRNCFPRKGTLGLRSDLQPFNSQKKEID